MSAALKPAGIEVPLNDSLIGIVSATAVETARHDKTSNRAAVLMAPTPKANT
jgi:hypothetical protein